MRQQEDLQKKKRSRRRTKTLSRNVWRKNRDVSRSRRIKKARGERKRSCVPKRKLAGLRSEQEEKGLADDAAKMMMMIENREGGCTETVGTGAVHQVQGDIPESGTGSPEKATDERSLLRAEIIRERHIESESALTRNKNMTAGLEITMKGGAGGVPMKILIGYTDVVRTTIGDKICILFRPVG